ncbi:helix-turn-helix transcriptional regulator [Sphingopyxis lindanitolerans]|nr:helix-turn-helix transcriptional regulator [Sphingopyxis lindanitolerans]
MKSVGIEEIYDAAFDRDLFSVLIERLVHAFGAQAGFIGWSDMERDAGFHTQFGNDPVWLQRYVETYAQHDLLQPILRATPEGVCAPAYPHLQTDEVRDSIFYREYLAPQNIIDNLAVNLIKQSSFVAHLALIRMAPAGPFTPDECAELSGLVPHLRRAIYIQSHLVHAADQQATRLAFSGVSRHVLLLTDKHVIAEIDPPLASLLTLRVGDGIGDGALGRTISAAIASGEPVALEWPGNDSAAPANLLCQARTLEPNRFGRFATGPVPTHAVHITELEQTPPIAFEAIADLYRLTPTELRVLRDAIEHGDLVGIGERVGMARATTRTHLHRIYDKTRTGSFVGLSNLAHRFARLTPE